jgi:ABC-type transporter Mla subunit MlaD
MSGNEAPDWAKQLQDALEQAGQEIGAALTRAGHILTAQGAMGWTFQGEFDKARTEIAKLPRDQIELLSMAARALADLADEEARR